MLWEFTVGAPLSDEDVASPSRCKAFFFFGIYKTKRYIDTLGVHSWEPPGTSRYAQHQR